MGTYQDALNPKWTPTLDECVRYPAAVLWWISLLLSVINTITNRGHFFSAWFKLEDWRALFTLTHTEFLLFFFFTSFELQQMQSCWQHHILGKQRTASATARVCHHGAGLGSARTPDGQPEAGGDWQRGQELWIVWATGIFGCSGEFLFYDSGLDDFLGEHVQSTSIGRLLVWSKTSGEGCNKTLGLGTQGSITCGWRGILQVALKGQKPVDVTAAKHGSGYSASRIRGYVSKMVAGRLEV